MPKVQAALELYSILGESNIDLRQPVGLEQQLLKDEALDSEVGQSMLQLLQVPLFAGITNGATCFVCLIVGSLVCLFVMFTSVMPGLKGCLAVWQPNCTFDWLISVVL